MPHSRPESYSRPEPSIPGNTKNCLRAAECALLFAGLPVVLSFLHLSHALLIVLWVLTLLCLRMLQRDSTFQDSRLWNRKAVTWRNFSPLAARFVVCAALLTLFVSVREPEHLFNFPLRNPPVWALVMVLYPILSVYPQEVLYRAFFFHRYRGLFRSNRAMIAASALAFGLMHVVFNNLIAVMFAGIGGAMFARTYARCQSLLLATLEHALYGCFVFTIGLGHYFYTGAVR